MALIQTSSFDSTLLDNALTKVEAKHAGVQRSEISISLSEIDESGTVRSIHHQPDKPFLTASVIKLFWLAFAAHELEAGRVQLTQEFQRAASDMIRVSSNDATGYIVNATTGALPGPELPPKEYEAWLQKRSAADRWFASLGYEGIRVLHRTYNEGSYGVERQAMGPDLEFRNRLTSATTVRLMTEVMQNLVITPARCEWMRALLARLNPADDLKADSQATGFIGGALPKGAMLWSKAGWTSINRHDVAAFTLHSGRRYVLCILTNYGDRSTIVTDLAAEIIPRLEGGETSLRIAADE